MLKIRNISMKWFVSYLIVLFIPIIIISIAYVKMDKLAQAEVHKFNQMILTQLRDEVDRTATSQKRLFASVSLNDSVMEMSNLNKSNISRQYKIASSIKRDISTSLYTDPLIETIAIYFNNLDFVVMPTGYCDSLNLYNMFFNKYMQYDNFKEMIADTYSYKKYITYGLDESRSNKEIAIIQSIVPAYYGKNFSVTMCVMLNETAMLNSIKKLDLSQQSYVIVLDSNNDIVISTDFDKAKKIDFSTLNLNDTLPVQSINRENSVISYTFSDYSQWKFVIVSDKSTYLHQLLVMRNTIIIAFFVSLIAGILFSLFMTKQNYSPVRNLVNQIEKAQQSHFLKGSDEYTYISESFGSTINKLDEIRSQLKSHEKTIADNLLYRILKGQKSPFDIDSNTLEHLNIDFKNDSFVVAVLYSANIETLLQKYVNMPISTSFDFFSLLLSDVFIRLGSARYNYTLLDMDDAIVVLFILKSDEHSMPTDNITLFISECLEFANVQFGFSFVAGLSNKNNGEFALSTCYNQADRALSCARFFGSNGIIAFNELAYNNDSYTYTLEQEMHLLNFIKSGDETNSVKLIYSILDDNIDHEKPNISLIRCLVFDILGSFLKLEKYPNVESFNLEYIDEILKNQNINTLRGLLKDITLNLCKENKTYMLQKRSDDIEKRITEYIKENYYNQDLSVTMVGDYFDITPSYLSKLFKDKTGISILDYIHHCRVEKAKELISQGNSTLDNMALKVGYLDSRALLRAFKKTEGITPSQYKLIEENPKSSQE